MNANLASIMPQVIGVWCEQEGHDVTLVCYTGLENLLEELPDDLDVLFVGAFTQSAQLAYAFSNLFRQQGAVTVLGGPHARCYPEDSRKYFDYVLGFTDRSVVAEMLRDCQPHRPYGAHLAAATQPLELPTLRERWKFAAATLAKAPTIKIVPMIGSLGCPYTCSFCIDSTVDYQPLGFEDLRDDLAFLLTKIKNPIVGWHDPNFGVRFDDYMEAVEAAVPQGRMRHIAESSLSLLSEPHLQRLRKNGFRRSFRTSRGTIWAKSKTRRTGMDKVTQVAEHVNLILRYIPYIQTNFVLGLDGDQGSEPFELTKKFLDLAPGAFPAYSLLSAFGRAAPSTWSTSARHASRSTPEQQPRDERPAEALRLAGVLRRPDRRDQLFVLLAGDRPARAGDGHGHPEVDERRAGHVVGGVGADQVPYDDPPAARHRPVGARVSGGGHGSAAGVLPRPHPAGAGADVRVPARRRAVPRPERVSGLGGRGARGGSRSAPEPPGGVTRRSATPPGAGNPPAQSSASRVRMLIQEPTRFWPPRNSKCSSAISRSPWGVAGAVRCQSSSCWPIADAGIQTPVCTPG
jgi:hypothetical protein